MVTGLLVTVGEYRCALEYPFDVASGAMSFEEGCKEETISMIMILSSYSKKLHNALICKKPGGTLPL